MLWERLLRDERLRDRPYETALVHFNWAEALRRLGDRGAARRAWARTQELLEQLADEFERRGQRERAFDCYGMLLRLGRDSGSFENVAEGYLNAIRLLAGDDQKFYVLQYYEDFLAYAVQSREWQAAATLAREAAEYCLKVGLLYERHYRQRSASLFAEAARQMMAAGGPSEMAENALQAAIDVSAGAGRSGPVRRAVRGGGRAAAAAQAQGSLRGAGGALPGQGRAGGARARRSRITCAAPTPTRTSGARTSSSGSWTAARCRCWPTSWSSGWTTRRSPGRPCGRCSTAWTRR